MKKLFGRVRPLALATAACIALSGLGACTTTIHEHPASLDEARDINAKIASGVPADKAGHLSGKGFSGSTAVIRAAGDIPFVPASKGQTARWSNIERTQYLYLDGVCQEQLYKQLPGWAQAIVKEGGWGALAYAVGEAGDYALYPGANLIKAALGGGMVGLTNGANTGRYRQDGSEKGAVGFCLSRQIYWAQRRWHIMAGIDTVPWYGDGSTDLMEPTNKETDPATPYVQFKDDDDDGGANPPPPPG